MFGFVREEYEKYFVNRCVLACDNQLWFRSGLIRINDLIKMR